MIFTILATNAISKAFDYMSKVQGCMTAMAIRIRLRDHIIQISETSYTQLVDLPYKRFFILINLINCLDA